MALDLHYLHHVRHDRKKKGGDSCKLYVACAEIAVSLRRALLLL